MTTLAEYFTNIIIMRILSQIWMNNQDISSEINFKISLQNAMIYDFKGFDTQNVT